MDYVLINPRLEWKWVFRETGSSISLLRYIK